MRKFKLLFVLIISFLFMDNTFAIMQFTCSYEYKNSGNKFNFIYIITTEVNGDINQHKIEKKTINMLTDEESIEDVTQYYKVDYELKESSRSCPKSIDITNVVISDGFENGEYKLLTKRIEHIIGGDEIIDDYTREDIGSSDCRNYKNKDSCSNSEVTGHIACVWNDLGNGKGYCNVDNLQYVSCGDARDIPAQAPAIISLLVNLLKIATPIILIFVSVITLIKALAAQKEDEIKKAQSSLVKKIISAVLVFFVIAIVQFVISKVAADDTENQNFSDCLNCFLNNNCEETKYYKTVIDGEEWCTTISNGSDSLCNPANE